MISRDFNDTIVATKEPSKMAKRYDDMIDKIINMLNTDGPIYTTWIRFQIGVTNPLIFDSTSTDLKKNLITSLHVEKTGAGVANNFTIKIKYDPFNYGQTTAVDKIEVLDDMIAKAMAFDIDTDVKSMRGYIQYGYNKLNDLGLVSPKYQFFLTKADSNIDWKTGVTEYTFEGVSELAIDCDFTTTIPSFTDKNLLDIVTTVLWSYYGKESFTSSHIITRDYYVKNEYNYDIVISDDLYKKAPTVSPSSVSDIGPFTYCRSLLAEHMSDSDEKNEEYKDLAKVKESNRPKYIMYINDTADNKNITINYITPKDTKNNTKLSHSFTWGTKNNSNIVENWNPQVDLYYYLIQKARALRAQIILDMDKSSAKDLATEVENGAPKEENIKQAIEEYAKKASIQGPVAPGQTRSSLTGVPDFNFDTAQGKTDFQNYINNEANKIRRQEVEAYYKDLEKTATTIPIEMYDAELTIMGIPADIPMACEVKIIPRQLETKSRTQGVYMVQGCTDNISNTGVFNSTLKLLRLRGINE